MSRDKGGKYAGLNARISGLNETIRDLNRAGAAATDMRDLMHSVGMIVVRRAAGLVPLKTGRLKGSLRAGRGKTKAVSRAGGARVPYAPVINYGWPRRRIRAVHFLDQALRDTRAAQFRAFDEGIEKLQKKNGMK